jgi:glycosyltransferase involved in cell wall biosynthesis
MRLIVQIPCLNEAETVGAVIREIPRTIEGVAEVKVLVIDDGSCDSTAEVAYRAGADYVQRLPATQGLARAFLIGLDACLQLGADLIVHTDGDHQYVGQDIPKLVAPLLAHEADLVIGDRQVHTLAYFSPLKKWLQRVGSRVMSLLTQTQIPDTTSGFRAYTREAALRLHVFSSYTYTLETLIQASHSQLAIVSVPVRTNPPARPSRLFSHPGVYVVRSLLTLGHMYVLYRPLRTFCYLGGSIFVVGLAGVGRFVLLWLQGHGAGHIQSLVISGVLLTMGFQVLVLGLLANLIGKNRQLGQEILYRLKAQGLADVSVPYGVRSRGKQE